MACLHNRMVRLHTHSHTCRYFSFIISNAHGIMVPPFGMLGPSWERPWPLAHSLKSAYVVCNCGCSVVYVHQHAKSSINFAGIMPY